MTWGTGPDSESNCGPSLRLSSEPQSEVSRLSCPQRAFLRTKAWRRGSGQTCLRFRQLCRSVCVSVWSCVYVFVGAWLSSECVPGPSCEYQVGHIAAPLSVSSRLVFLMSVSLACMRLSVPVSPLVFFPFPCEETCWRKPLRGERVYLTQSSLWEGHTARGIGELVIL